jgi:chromate transporter
LRDLVMYFLRLGTTGFGGPVALVGYMHRDLVEKRNWIREEDYREGLALSQLAPGPLAAQLSIYIGYVRYGILGATLAGLAFVLPSFIMVLLLGMAYVQYGGLSWIQFIFYGISASVIGIIAFSAFKLTKKSIGTDWFLWTIFGVSAVTTVITESESVWLFLAAGIIYMLIKVPSLLNSIRIVSLPVFLLKIPTIAAASIHSKILFFFLKAGAFVFGSGLAIVPFLYSGVVKEFGWLNEQQFMDSVAVAMITPGPVVITVGFIGFLVAGFSGASVAALATFLPCYLFTILPAPYFKKYGRRPAIKAFVDGVTAAAIGAISGAVVILAQRSLIDIPTVIIAALTIVILWKAKVPEPLVIVAAAVIGFFIRSVSINSIS